MNITIKNMETSDLDLISNNLTKDFDDFWNVSTFKNELENSNSTYFVAKSQKDEIIGFAGVWFGYEEAHITNIVTRKDKRNIGIGSLLLNHLINFCKKQNNILSITLEVKETNISAIKLYEKFEFEKVGMRKNYYLGNENAIIMTKTF